MQGSGGAAAAIKVEGWLREGWDPEFGYWLERTADVIRGTHQGLAGPGEASKGLDAQEPATGVLLTVAAAG